MCHLFPPVSSPGKSLGFCPVPLQVKASNPTRLWCDGGGGCLPPSPLRPWLAYKPVIGPCNYPGCPRALDGSPHSGPFITTGIAWLLEYQTFPPRPGPDTLVGPQQNAPSGACAGETPRVLASGARRRAEHRSNASVRQANMFYGAGGEDSCFFPRDGGSWTGATQSHA